MKDNENLIIESFILKDESFILKDIIDGNNINKLVIPEGIKIVDSYALEKCPNLEEIIYPKSIMTISLRDLLENKKLSKITIPKSKINEILIDNDQYSKKPTIYNSYIINNEKILTINNIEYILKQNTSKELIDIKINNPNNEKSIDKINEILEVNSIETLKNLIKSDISIETLKHNFDLLEIYSTNETRKILSDNPIIYDKAIDDLALENYKYLEKQNLLDKTVLQKLYFDFNFNTEEEFKTKLKEKLKDKSFDFELFNTLIRETNELNQLELRDRLVVATTMKYIDNNSLNNKYAISKILKQDTFTSIVDNDKQLFNKKYINKYDTRLYESKFFNGINYHLTKELEKMNINILELLSRNTNNKDFSFINSLNTIKNWNEYGDQKEQATLLKNEIIGRSLYAIIKINLDNNIEYQNKIQEYNNLINAFNNKTIDISNSKFKKEKRRIKNEINNIIQKIDINYNINVYDNKFIDLITNTDLNSIANDKYIEPIDVFSNQMIINRMLKENSYSFDALRGNKEINSDFYKIASKNGYYFKSLKEKQLIDLSKLDNIDLIAHQILNDIGINKIPEEDEEEYLNNIKILIDNYFINHTEDTNLLSIFRSVDVYLRKNSIYDYQKVNNPATAKLSKEIFDYSNDKYNDIDRLIYSLYNLNQLAHGITSVNLRVLQIDTTKYKTNSNGINELTKIKNAITGYNELQKYGLTIELINDSIIKSNGYIKTTNRIKELENKLNDPNIKEEDKTLIVNEINTLKLKIVENLEYQIPYNARPSKSIDFNDINSIKNIIYYLESINNIKEETRDNIKLDAKENSIFFKTKALIAQQYLNKLYEYIFQSVIYQKDSLDYFKDNEYTFECQRNITGDLLVCYNPKFSEPFSIHLKDLPREFQTKFEELKDKPNRLSHTKISGLTPRKINIVINQEEIPVLDTGFITDNSELSNKIIQINNFFKFDIYSIQDIAEKLLKMNNISYKDLKTYITYIDKRLILKDAENKHFEGDNISIRDKYRQIVGYDKLINKLNTLKNTNTLETMLDDKIEVLDDLNNANNTKK